VHLWQQSRTPERGLPWLVRALGVYNHDGLYEIATRFGPAVEANLQRMFASDPQLHAMAVLNLFFSYIALGRAEDALQLVVTQGLGKTEDLQVLTDLHYDMGMLYARFLPNRDLDRAEAHLFEALALIPRLDVPEARRHFLRVFNRNGLAYVRFRQGRAEEALELCESGLRELDAALPPDQHRLHRSVLLYNAAQVLSALGRYDDAIVTLSRAMEMDPNYSEYYLERGGLLLKLERFDEAEEDLRRAIELSPPYAESWTDLGQCYRAAGRMPDAEHAYTRALDLDPRVSLALVGRAEALVEQGRPLAALEDYSAALALEPDQPLVLAGRAVAHFEACQPAQALNDLDRAIELAPAIPELYQNRATALAALGHSGAARQDLELYLRLQPDAADRELVERQLGQLSNDAHATPSGGGQRR
jgi:tetratricopeptide (TPR) repeat protein